ncbi:zinc-binding alcohol dehydrogenase family protein [Panacibacter sp. DH6]|uniref:Zinc-binding alcohol dehydrogenase family protein n=1 Tax=Panacibacter microcysteis TaxID=2793269 RepID=A0A931H053_9BACT|nr:zinc-binding alcohol dehydrogenase family protein [Panacibacter microcysteis]MBG9378581.1 zinc-binding alcohol dehydrogenase family protein [Panacibacter microcysteis]
MTALVCTKPGFFEYRETDMPILEDGQVLLKIRRIGICGTDLHAFEGTQPYFSYPRILGHELAAEVVHTAAIYRAGDEVTIIPYFNCGNCIACNSGKPNCCVSMQVAGVHTDGGMREYFAVPATAIVTGQGLSLDQLALAEPLAIGAHAIRRANVQPGEHVLVIGAGPIGLATMAFAKIAGATVIAADVNAQRLRFCDEQLGIPHIVNVSAQDINGRLKEITHNNMPSVVIDATGNLKAINGGFSYIAHGGRYVLVGLQKGDIGFSHPEFHKREATLMSSRNATREDFDHVIQCIQQQLVKPEAFITHRAAFGEVKEQFSSWLQPGNAVIKAMVELY